MKTKLSLLLLLCSICAFADDNDFSAVNDGATIYYKITSPDEPRTVMVCDRDFLGDAPVYSGIVNIPETVSYDGKTYAVTAIRVDAFLNCSNLISVTIPNSVTSIEKSAFRACTGLISIKMPNSIVTIEDHTFMVCSSLASIEIPNSVTSIGEGAFLMCGNLTSVTIPNLVTSIGLGAFGGCSGLKEMFVKAETPPVLGNMDPFAGIPKTIPLYVPCGKLENYQNVSKWKNAFTNMIEVPFYSITLSSNDDAMGAVEKTQAPTCTNGKTAIIEAAAFPDYHFVKWNDGVTTNPRNITVTQDTSFTATFAENVSPRLLQDLEDVVICIGESHTFEIEAEGDNLSYEWYYGNERITGANGNTYTVTNAEFRDYERYYVIVRSQIGSYRSSVYSKNVRLWVADQLPESLQFVDFPSTVTTGNTYRIKLAGYPDVTQYVWSYSNDGVTFSPETGGIGENETLATFSTLSAGQGMLTVTLTHPCGTRQATQPIRVYYPTGTPDVTANKIAVSPNPTSGIIKVSGTKSGQIIRIVDIAGSLKGDYPAQEGETTIDLTGFSKGTYLLQYGGKTVKVVKK